MRPRRRGFPEICLPLIHGVILLTLPMALAQHSFDGPPIYHGSVLTEDPVAQLQERLRSGESSLAFDDVRGYLPSLLDELDISHSSQMLVFSKTSLQLRLISPQHPRALYFCDDVYVGWVPRSETIEIISVDPKAGPQFYTLKKGLNREPEFKRDSGQCLDCHATYRTEGVPGPLIRSVFADHEGQPLFQAGSFDVDHSTSLASRWGGYYVTGSHGNQLHMGNAWVHDPTDPRDLDRRAGANVSRLDEYFDVAQYLSPTSDIIALMVIEHQAKMQNLITKAGYEARMAAWYDESMNKALDRPVGFVSETTYRRIDKSVERLLSYLLFANQLAFEEPLMGSPQFVKDFVSLGKQDSKGRSLRDFDLQRRLFRFPCSYMIYSGSFDALPKRVKIRVYDRLQEILSGQDRSPPFRHLRENERIAVMEILRETKDDLPSSW